MTPVPVPLQRFWWPGTEHRAAHLGPGWVTQVHLDTSVPSLCQDRSSISLSEGATLCAPFHPSLGTLICKDAKANPLPLLKVIIAEHLKE